MASRKAKHQKALEKRGQFMKTTHQGEIPKNFNGESKTNVPGAKHPKRASRRRR